MTVFPRPQQNYTTAADSQVNTERSSFNKLLDRDDQAELWQPDYEKANTIRILPQPFHHPDLPDLQWEPCRWASTEGRPGELGNWIAKYWVADFFGLTPVTFAVSAGVRGFNAQNDSVPGMIYSRIQHSVKKNYQIPGSHEWAKLFLPQEGSYSKPLNPPTINWFFQAAIIRNCKGPRVPDKERGGNFTSLKVPWGSMPSGTAENDKAVIMRLSFACGRSLNDLLYARKNNDENWDDWRSEE